ncbi:MAG: protein kinase [Myxococcota bacterium]
MTGSGPGYPNPSDDLNQMDAPEDDGFQGPSGFSPIPRTVGDYQLVSRVGGGSMAELYIGRKVSQYGFVHRAVIKQVKRSRSDFRQLQGMLLDEARATACFDHPNLVKIYDVGEVENGLYLALEYVEGTDLRRVNQKLRSRKEALPFELACYIVSEVLRGVHHAHTAQGPDGQHLEIVHRDVNPSNVLVANSGHVKLADFGVVRMRERIQPKTEPGLLKGKYAYLAPEYIAGEACSVQTDVYAAGIMLFELLSGRECFTGSTAYEVMWKIVNKGVPMYRLQREGVPEDLQRLVARATSMVPERRYASAQDMANALEAWLMRSQKHATPWVLSVFFHRHDLFRQPLDPPFQPLANRTPPGDAASPTAAASDAHSPPMADAPSLRPTGPTSSSSAGIPVRDNSVSERPFFQSSPAARTVDDSLTPTPQLAGDVPLLGFQQTADTKFLNPMGGEASIPISAPLTSPLAAPVPPSSRLSEPQMPTQPAISGGWRNMPEENDLVSARNRPNASSVGVPQSGHRPRLQDFETNAPVPVSSAPTSPPAVDTSDLAAPPSGSSSLKGPVSSGKLEEHPAVDVLEYLGAHQATGIIEFRCGLIWKRVLMTGGKPTGVTSNMGMELIGEHLVKARIISRDDLEKALQTAERAGKPLTVCLLEQSALTREALEIELGRNLAARLQEVLEWRWGTYEFIEQAMDPVEILPKLDLAGLLTNARSNRMREDASANAAAPTAVDDDTPQTKLKEALRVARSIAKSTGKGRVDRPWRNTKP